MQAPGGGYYAALDADSEGEEGRYYLWTPQKVQVALRDGDFPLFAAAYGLDRAPNFEGRWHLNRRIDTQTLAVRFGLGAIEEIPFTHASLLLALDEQLHPTEVLVVRAPCPDLPRWQERLHLTIAPRRLGLAIPSEEGDLPGLLGSRPSEQGPVAILCGPSGCLAPIRDLDTLDRQLSLSELPAMGA